MTACRRGRAILTICWCGGICADGLSGSPITLDPLELRGIDYHTGIGFAFFGAGVSSRWQLCRVDEEATEFVYMERVLRDASVVHHVYLPADLG